MTDRLTITVSAGGDNADARAFGAVLRDTLAALDALAKERTNGEVGQLQWRIVEMEKNSPPRVTIENTEGLAIVSGFLAGMRQLEEKAVQPFATPVMRSMRRIARRIGVSIDQLVYESPNEAKVVPTQNVAANAKAAMAWGYYWAETSIEGKLDIVNIHRRPRFSIFDELEGHEVRCRFKDEMLDAVKAFIAHRVIVFGNVKFRTDTDAPVGIIADSIESLDSVEPKGFADMPVIDITGGVASEVYVRRMRDGE